jgi:hypothetical protein
VYTRGSSKPEDQLTPEDPLSQKILLPQRILEIEGFLGGTLVGRPLSFSAGFTEVESWRIDYMR